MSDASRPEKDHPLGMTVYDLPSPNTALQADAKRTLMGRLRMLAVLLICASPVLASYFTYYVVRPEGRRNFGELIQPTRSLPNVSVQSLAGQKIQLPELKGQWLLVSVADAACDAICLRNLYLQRQILMGLGKERDRTEWVWLVTDTAPVPVEIMPGLKEANVLRIDPKALPQWLVPAEGKTLSEHLFVVDPHGEWMMRFPAQLSDEGALKAKKDLERLLRAAAAWDEAGR